jgi:hypothetical protein
VGLRAANAEDRKAHVCQLISENAYDDTFHKYLKKLSSPESAQKRKIVNEAPLLPEKTEEGVVKSVRREEHHEKGAYTRLTGPADEP